MFRFQAQKDNLLKPLLRLLNKSHINAISVSISGAVLAAIGFALSLMLHQPILFLITIWLHVLFDAIDGPLARFSGTTSSQGILVDVIADFVGIVTASLFATYFAFTPPSSVLIFIALYGVILTLSFLRNRLGVPFLFIIRPRFLVFTTLTIDFISRLDITPLIYTVSNILLGLSCMSGALTLGYHSLATDALKKSGSHTGHIL